MKWKYYALAENDARAKGHVLENVEMSAYAHTFGKKLLARVSQATGPMVLVAFDNIDLDAPYLYAYATYSGGKPLREVYKPATRQQSDTPIGGLVTFIESFLRASEDAVVLCDRWIERRDDVLQSETPPESRVLFFGQDVYRLLTSEDANFDAIEAAVRESTDRWGTGVCSFCGEVPDVEIPSEAFLDTIVANTAHVFVPALDGGGYLIWSPR